MFDDFKVTRTQIASIDWISGKSNSTHSYFLLNASKTPPPRSASISVLILSFLNTLYLFEMNSSLLCEGCSQVSFIEMQS